MGNLKENFVNMIREGIIDDLTSIMSQEVIIRNVSENGGIVAKHVSSPSENIDTELGPISGGTFGLFSKPLIGSKALVSRVFAGSTNHTQVLKVIINPAQQEHNSISNPLPDTPPGIMRDGNYEIGPGSVMLRSINNQKVLLKSDDSTNGSIEITDNNGGGFHIESLGPDSSITEVAHYIQSISSASKIFSGSYHQTQDESNFKKSASDIHAVARPNFSYINKIGLFFPSKGQDAWVQKNPRNVPLTFYKNIINQVSDTARYIGINNEKQIFELKENVDTAYSKVELGRLEESRKIYNLFFMSPDQIVQVISGNILSEKNNYNPININYGITNFTALSSPRQIFQLKEEGNVSFLKIKNSFKRGIGYHFQVNTHDDIMDDFSSIKNARVIFDKEGVLKINIPKSSVYGNIMYVDDTYFMKGSDNYKPEITNEFANPSREEQIPITLRGEDNKILLPAASKDPKKFNKTRYTGIEFSNGNGYFGKQGDKVRVNTTKYHNMYSACEMLLANYITKVNKPPDGLALGVAVATGSPGLERFERFGAQFSGILSSPSEKNYQINSIGTVEITPQPPILNPGGSVIVCGQESGDSSSYSNNDLEQSGTAKSYSGVSANANLEGSLEMSIGADNADGKSLSLDTDGSVVSWLGKDKNGRSLAVQTDGSILVNVGGHNGNEGFNSGRFDLRVNLTDKGTMQDSSAEVGRDSDVIISISENGIVISGMKKGVPMIINNSDSILIQSPGGITLDGGQTGVLVKEKNRPAREISLSQSNTANSIESGETLPGSATIEKFITIAENIQSYTGSGSKT